MRQSNTTTSSTTMTWRVVDRVLGGEVSLDSFVRWCEQNPEALRADETLAVTLRRFADGALSVDALYQALSDWWYAQQQQQRRPHAAAHAARVAANEQEVAA